ncbi:MAG: TAXI family TRAP transporter solute-binding subunit [Candidatus Rokubacteria bacterium]|nr:TAXI family TRAP transporter solute-binding subunit [Candidatus Rokubacteria bacterium]
MRAIHRLWASALALMLLTGPSQSNAAEAKQKAKLTIATGIGVPLMIGTGMGMLINRLIPEVEATVQDFADEQEIVRLVSQGKAGLGLVPIPEIAKAYPLPGDRERSGLRFLMGGHAAIVAHLFVRQGSPINSVHGLKAKRIALDEAGGPGKAMAAAILQAHGLSQKDLKVIHLPVREQVDALRTARVDAAFMVAPLPSPLVSSPGPTGMTKAGDVKLLSMNEAELRALVTAVPAYSRHTIEVGTYPGQKEEVRTIARKNALIAHEGLDDAHAYRIVQVILEYPAEFQQVCPLGVAYTAKNALPGTPLLSLHPGAERYYREKGILLAGQGSESASDGYDVSGLIEIRPAGGNVVGPGADLLPHTLVEQIQNVPHVAKIEAYLFVGVVDKAKERPFFVIGGNLPGATFRVNCHNVDAVKVIDGRGLGAEDAGRKVAVIGTRYAETYAPPGRRQIPIGATIDLVKPGMAAGALPLPGEAKVRVVGIFSSAFPLGDSQVLLPLDTAQRLFGLEGKVSKIFVTLDASDVRDQVAETLRARLGDDVDVVYPRRGGMR